MQTGGVQRAVRYEKNTFKIACYVLLIAFNPFFIEVAYANSDTTVKIASWNIRIFSNGSRDDVELKQICQIIIKYDLLAIVELRDQVILQRTESMLETMGRDYDYEFSTAVGRGVKERYAFLYDKEKFKVIKPGVVFPDPDDAFIREPFYATFKVDEFDFTIVVIHVIWGSKVADRQAEISKLGDVYTAIQEQDENEQDILLVGDFNRRPGDESFAKLETIPSMEHLFSLPAKTNIRDTKLYDNIWFQSRYVTEYNGTKGIDKFDETFFAFYAKKLFAFSAYIYRIKIQSFFFQLMASTSPKKS